MRRTLHNHFFPTGYCNAWCTKVYGVYLLSFRRHLLTCIGLVVFSSNCCHSTQTEVRAGWKALDSCDLTFFSHFDLVLVSKNSPQPAPTLAMERRKWRFDVELCVCKCLSHHIKLENKTCRTCSSVLISIVS